MLGAPAPPSGAPGFLHRGAIVVASKAFVGFEEHRQGRIAAPGVEAMARSTRATRLLPELHDAIRDRQLVLHGQPVVDVATGVPSRSRL